MAETLISPGVLARENDQSQITAGPIQAGAALVAGLTDGINDSEERDRFVKSFDKAGYDAVEIQASIADPSEQLQKKDQERAFCNRSAAALSACWKP